MLELGIAETQLGGSRGVGISSGAIGEYCQQRPKTGVIGRIHPLVRQNFDIKPRACAFELDMDTLFALAQPRIMMEQITRYPAVRKGPGDRGGSAG